jgi:hypothetical protein
VATAAEDCLSFFCGSQRLSSNPLFVSTRPEPLLGLIELGGGGFVKHTKSPCAVAVLAISRLAYRGGMVDLGHDPSSVEPPPASVLEDARFAVGAHPAGPILSVIVGDFVAFNLRIDPPVAWALLGVTVIDIDRKPLEAALTGLYTKVLTDSHSRHLVESIQEDQ